MARTGSGKTAAFCIPLLERYLHSQRRKLQQSTSSTNAAASMSAAAIILSPTRELSLQTLRVLQTLSTYIVQPNINCIGINGGESMEKQFSLLSSRPDVIVATPGRLAHHLSEIPDFHLKHCDLIIFDEADRLFEMGFAMQIRQICHAMPNTESGRQTLLFSATMPKVLIEFTRSGIMDSDPNVVRLDKESTVSEELRIGFVCVRSQDKDAALMHLLRDVLPQAKCIANKNDKNLQLANQIESDSGEKGQKGKNAKNKLQFKGGVIGSTDDNANRPKLGLTLIFAATRHHVDFLTLLINNSGIGGHQKDEDNDLATCIYGSMDQEARKQNLYSFRSGKTPIMVVTDVAARGIDVPLIDHVIHYSFPANAKLFVHRSGRAARAGRIGYCWGLVDAEEMGYMVDLYLFLGRKLSTGQKEPDKNDDDGGSEEENGEKEDVMYDVGDMTPEMVHYGSVPESTLTEEVENVRRIVESELTSSHDAETLRSLLRVCRNAMKQYRRSRPEASRQGMTRAKSILEGKKELSGKRVGGGMIASHPVLRRAEVQRIMATHGYDEDDGKAKKDVKIRLDQLKQREDFLRAMSNFRPKETIFESFATGGGKTPGVVSHIDKGCTTNNANKKNSSAAFDAMKSMRRQMKLAHNKGVSLVVAGSDAAMAVNGETEECTDHDGENNTNTDAKGRATTSNMQEKKGSPKPVITEKRRLSKAERKRLKKQGSSSTSSSQLPIDEGIKKTKNKRGDDFRDNAFYIDNEITQDSEEAQRGRHIEAAMQPSSANANDGTASALRLEQAMLDIVGDENVDLVKKHRIMRWDKTKRKYIQTTIGSELSGDSKSKKLRLESGQFIKKDKAKLGELYEKWQKKTNKSIGRVGVFDDVTTDDADDDGIRGGRVRKTQKQKGGTNNRVESDLKTATQVRKKRDADEKMKLKNMKKSDRSRLEKAKRTARNAKMNAVGAEGKGYQGKKGFSGRYGSQPKGKGGKRR
jgi:ATP-dependent RNA helicase DDX54/DBP10